jgi:SWI/SNF-related matrix-associated actin-dependent regulator of chromatin subfamily A member 5
MREYQMEGLNWLLKMDACKINGVLADEMGLGKTLQTISLLGHLDINKTSDEGRHPHLIIVPKGTLPNWMREFRHWCPSLQVFEFYGNL